jgi:hypothetical protein
LQVGDQTGELELDGDYSQTGGQIVFDVESNGEGGFDVSTLDFVNGANIDLNDVDIVIDFLDGADPSLYAPGGLNIADFFQVTGNSSFLADFGNVFSGDTFTMEGTNLTNTDLDFDPTTGGLVPEEEGPGPLSTPEPSTLLLLLPGLGILRLRFSRRRVRRPAPSV